MKFLRLLGCVLFASLLVATAAEAADRKGTTEGTFTGIEQGDYAHLQLKTAAGRQETFFVLNVNKSVQPFVDSPKKMKGRKIRVHWRERQENVPESGGKMLVKSVQRVEPLK
jgi:hypothetical protein